MIWPRHAAFVLWIIWYEACSICYMIHMIWGMWSIHNEVWRFCSMSSLLTPILTAASWPCDVPHAMEDQGRRYELTQKTSIQGRKELWTWRWHLRDPMLVFDINNKSGDAHVFWWWYFQRWERNYECVTWGRNDAVLPEYNPLYSPIPLFLVVNLCMHIKNIVTVSVWRTWPKMPVHQLGYYTRIGDLLA